jgi:hypothetical protein
MRNFLIVLSATILLLVSLSFLGCGSDDDDNPTGVPAVACSIDLTNPVTGERFLPGAVDSQTVKIRWEKAGGSAMVNIDLLKGGVDVTRLVEGGLNSGYYSWRADNHGQEDGTDFSVRVSSYTDSGCSSVSDEFILRNTIGCDVDFTNIFADSLHVGDEVTLTWENIDTPGLVDILLELRDHESQVLAVDQPQNGSFTWTVDTFGMGTNDRFTFRVVDTLIPVYCYNQSVWTKIQE